LSFVDGLGVFRDALEAVPEASVAFAEAFAKFRKLFAAKKDDDDERDEQQMPGLKDIHVYSPYSRCADSSETGTTIVAQERPVRRYVVEDAADGLWTLYLGSEGNAAADAVGVVERDVAIEDAW
jgi:hypothetical protein